jgi:hypothetical protein
MKVSGTGVTAEDLGGLGLAPGGVAEGDDAFGQFVGDGAGVVDQGVEELVDGQEVGAAEVPVQLLEDQGEVDGGKDDGLEQFGLTGGVEILGGHGGAPVGVVGW